MRLTLDQVKEASKCFKYYSFLQETTQVYEHKHDYVDIIIFIIKNCYIRVMETEFRATWRNVISWTNAEVFKKIDVYNKVEVKEAKKTTEKILTFIRLWYYQIYIVENIRVFIDVPITRTLGTSSISCVVPIIKLDKYPTIVLISNVAVNIGKLYNDINIRGMQWMLSEVLECDTIAVQHLFAGKDGKIRKLHKTMLYAQPKEHEKTKEFVGQISTLLQMGVNWPSFTEMCNNCPYKKGCKI